MCAAKGGSIEPVRMYSHASAIPITNIGQERTHIQVRRREYRRADKGASQRA